MGPSRFDPGRQVAVFVQTIQKVSAVRAIEMERFRWIAGEWDFENLVPPTRLSPAYTDVGASRFSISEDGGWVWMVSPDGNSLPCLTFDPLSCNGFMYLLVDLMGCLDPSKDGSEIRSLSKA